MLFAGIGEEGQKRLCAASAVIVGCGAIGGATASLLARAGVARLRVIDRDFVEPSNLQRQLLFDESDASEALPKAVAAERKLRAMNSAIAVEGCVADLNPRNAEQLLRGWDLILDGTDNFETRFLINDWAAREGRSWIYAAAVAAYGVSFVIRPGSTACLACLMESSSTDAEETCDTVGVLGPVVNLVASLQAGEAIKILAGRQDALHGRLVSCNVWTGRLQSLNVPRNAQCPVCVRGDFRYLAGAAQPRLTLCGRDSVQIHEKSRKLDLAALRSRLVATAEVRSNDYLLRFRVPPFEITVFTDGRAIVKGTRDPAVARSLYARYIGS